MFPHFYVRCTDYGEMLHKRWQHIALAQGRLLNHKKARNV